MELPQHTPHFTGEPVATPGIRREGIGDLLPPSFHVDGLYVHVPFCQHRCHYCDFFTLAGREDAVPGYVDRAVDELWTIASKLQGEVHTVFLGGGTPTLLPPDELARLLDAIQRALPLADGVEWTVEANPETVTAERATVLAEGGVNRISLGAQSFDPALLKALERQHDPDNVERSIACIRSAGIEHFSIDLIYAIPGQTLAQWTTDLQRAVDLGLDHLSCYGLVYEAGTPLTRRRDRGLVTPVQESTEARMHCTARDMLAQQGYEQYEISNWARAGRYCQHNLIYWENRNWWPIGPGASGHVDGVRWKNEPRLGTYVDGDGLSAASMVESLDPDGRVGEAFMLGLRVLSGMTEDRLESLLLQGQHGLRRRAAIDRHIDGGLLERHDGGIRFSTEGVLLADTVLADLL
ncbi:MAG: radical SAM family heme chaperone HemW [Phycisphaerales bacterium]|nr:radical SAM family heme chaperone HemW [Phycisphaerales bacterium]